MEAANADEIRTDERAASDVSVGFWVSSRPPESRVHNQEADVQGLLGLWRRVRIAGPLFHVTAQRF